MAERYSFFDAKLDGGAYDRTYSAADFADYFSTFVSNGIDLAGGLKASATGGMCVAIAPGKAFANGYFYHNDSDRVFTLDAGDSSYPRVDSVCVTLDPSARTMLSRVVKGTPSPQPVAPEPRQVDGGAWDLVLAHVHVEAGATSVKQEHVTDTRYDSALCGVVGGFATTFDSADLFNDIRLSFDTWFADVQSTLDGDVVGNVLSEIRACRDEVDERLAAHDASVDEKVAAVPVITVGTAEAPATGTPGSIYIQLL